MIVKLLIELPRFLTFLLGAGGGCGADRLGFRRGSALCVRVKTLGQIPVPLLIGLVAAVGAIVNGRTVLVAGSSVEYDLLIMNEPATTGADAANIECCCRGAGSSIETKFNVL